MAHPHGGASVTKYGHFRFTRYPGTYAGMTDEQLERSAIRIVQAVLSGERVGYNNGLHWAAAWVEAQATGNADPKVKEFAANVAMSIRAAMRKRENRPQKPLTIPGDMAHVEPWTA